MPSATGRLPRVLTVGAAVLLTTAAACLQDVKRPEAPLRGTLDLPGGEVSGPSGHEGPVRVVFATPQGETTQLTEVSLVFNKPMRALDAVPDARSFPVLIEPAIPGSWQWLGSSALRFNAKGRLPLATSFRVEVPAGTKALDGTELQAPFVFSFATPRPALEASWPEHGSKDLLPDAKIELSFNQPTAMAEVNRAVSLRDGDTPLLFNVADEGSHYLIVPRAPLPLGSKISLRIADDLHAASGDLPSGKEQVLRFETIGPLAASFRCDPHPTQAGRCAPSSAISLDFTNDVPAEQIIPRIHIQPKPENFEVYAYSGEEGRTFEVHGDYQPAKSYRVRLTAGAGQARIKDVANQSLKFDATATLRFGDLLPAVYLGASGTYWPSSEPHNLPVSVLNATGVEVRAVPIGLAELLQRLVDPKTPIAFGAFQGIASGDPNKSRTSIVKLDDLLPAGARGPFVVRQSHTPNGATERSSADREFQLTDIGMVSRVGSDGGLVWLSGIDNAKLMAGAKVDVYGIPAEDGKHASRLASTTTDARGLAIFDIAPGPDVFGRLAVVAREKDDWTYQTISMPRKPRPVGFIYDERGIYRPGEQVKLSGAFRVPSKDGLKTPAHQRVRLEAIKPGGEMLSSWSVTLSAFGTFSSTLSIPASAPLGGYSVKAVLDDATVYDRFRVDEYVPIENTVEMHTDRPAYQRGERLKCLLRGKYLHGGPMAGAKASIIVSRTRGSYSIPNLDKYTINDVDVSVPRRSIEARQVELDERGTFELPVDLQMPEQQTTEAVSCETEVYDLNRRALSGWAQAIVHPSDIYVALQQSESWSVEPGQRITARTLVVTPDGARRSRPVHLELIRRWHAEESPSQSQVVASCDVTPGKNPAACTFVVPRGKPAYQDEIVVRASTTDARGMKLTAAYQRSIVAPIPAYVQPAPPPAAPAPPPPPRLMVDIDRGPYAPGDVAKVQVSSPLSKESDALLTVEREGILEQRQLRLPPHGAGPKRFDVPVTEAMIPYASVNVVVLAGRSSYKAEAELRVKVDSRVLSVDVRPAQKNTEPGASVDVDVLVRDHKGKPARSEVTLWAADEGSLQLAGYRVPEPVDRLFNGFRFLVESEDSRDSLVRIHMFGYHRTRPPRVRMGATSVNPPRGDFRQTVFYAPHLVTDANGRVRRRVKLPDGLTTYRFMAVAVAADDRFGSGRAKVVTNKSLMARPTMPRVIRAGDTFEASVIVSTHDLAATDVTVDVTATGLTAAGPGRKSVRLEPERPVEVRVPFRAEKAGPVRFRVDARAASEAAADAVVIERSVVAPRVIETATLHGETSKPVAEQLASLASVRPDVGSLTISLAATPLAGLETGFEQVLEYPYGCTEQRVSRFVPLVVAYKLGKALGVEMPLGAPSEPGAKAKATGAYAKSLRTQVRAITANQHKDGGFGFWAGSRDENPWLTAYALWGLVEARRHGIAVPDDVLQRGMHYLTSRPLPDEDDPMERELLATEAFTLDILAAEGKGIGARADALFERRDRLPVFGRALLLHALATHSGRSKKEQVEALTNELEGIVRLDGPAAHVVAQSYGLDPSVLYSSTRTTAMVLRALVALNPEHPMVTRLARGLLAERKHGRFRSTQEAAWALIALGAYHETRNPNAGGSQPFDARVFWGDELLTSHRFEPATWGKTAKVEVPMARLASAGSRPITFDVGGGALHYEATLHFARRKLPTKPVEAGFFVSKTMRPIATLGAVGTAVSDTGDVQFTAGQVVLCEVQVITPSPRHNVVVDDPLPGGFEAVDFSLGMGADWLQSIPQGAYATSREFRDDRVLYFEDELPAGITTYRYLARATSLGRFVMPPTRVEEMYVPETYGMTATRWVQVR
jgi:alpha-2-macroglobulin